MPDYTLGRLTIRLAHQMVCVAGVARRLRRRGRRLWTCKTPAWPA